MPRKKIEPDAPDFVYFRVVRPVCFNDAGTEIMVIEVPATNDFVDLDLDRADLSDIQVIRATLQREGRHTENDEALLRKLSLRVVAGVSREEAQSWASKYFGIGGWPVTPVQRDSKGRVIWSRQDLKEMAPRLAEALRQDSRVAPL